MRTPLACQPCSKRPSGRWWLVSAVLAALSSLSLASEVPSPVAVLDGLPEEAVVAVTWMGGGSGVGGKPNFIANDAWVDFAFSTIDDIMVPVESSWRSACGIADQLIPDRGFRMHATGPGGRHWIQAARWQDPIAVEQGLRRLGTQAMGGGRFRLPVAGLQVVVREGWIVLAPQESPWIDRMIRDLEAGESGFSDLGEEAGSTFEVMFRHSAPVSGISRLIVHPESGWDARIDLHGDYSASPLPIRPATPLHRQDVERLRGRFALVVQESGIGLLDLLRVGSPYGAVEDVEGMLVARPNHVRSPVAAAGSFLVGDGDIDLSGCPPQGIPASLIRVARLDQSERQIFLRQPGHIGEVARNATKGACSHEQPVALVAVRTSEQNRRPKTLA